MNKLKEALINSVTVLVRKLTKYLEFFCRMVFFLKFYFLITCHSQSKNWKLGLQILFPKKSHPLKSLGDHVPFRRHFWTSLLDVLFGRNIWTSLLDGIYVEASRGLAPWGAGWLSLQTHTQTSWPRGQFSENCLVLTKKIIQKQ